ncbi:MAG TPA: Ig-like domain-containing protein [Dongiaceae bacterium]|nr:Ig-like domain-containing protein [Dongiaceae bacterium]
MRRTCAWVACLLWSVWLCSCGGSSNATPQAQKTLTSISVSSASASVQAGATDQLTATGKYSDGSSQDLTTTVTWSSSDTTKAVVNSSGLCTAGQAGSVTISAAYNGLNGSTAITVNAPNATLKGVAISPTNATVNVGQTQQLTATASFSDGSQLDVTQFAVWASSDTTMATVQSSGQASPGLAQGVGSGSPNLTASYAGVTALTILNVTTSGGNLTGLLLSETNPSMAPGTTLQFVTRASSSNGSKGVVTNSTHWTTDNAAVATVEDQGQSNPGLVTAVAAGTATITASFNGFSASTTVTVTSAATKIPLMDMTSSDTYLGFAGGLYENSTNTVPAIHDTAGMTAANAIQPLDQQGNPSSTGAVVFLSIGMSNATIEFTSFQNQAAQDSGVNHSTLAIEDGAYGAVTACPWTVAQGPASNVCIGATGVPGENQYDRVRDTVLATAVGAPSAPANCGTTTNPCLTENQVQVVWIKEANPDPGEDGMSALSQGAQCVLPSTIEVCRFEGQLGNIIRAAKSRYPNLKQVFLTTRIYAGYAVSPLNPEPYAYEYGFSAKWLIQAQINEERNPGQIDPVAGEMNFTAAAWTAWSAYIWADGTTPRSDGLTWQPTDFQADGTHPNSVGAQKVVNQLMSFFKSSPYTPWFRP